MPRCRNPGCGAEIQFQQTDSGGLRPVDPDGQPHWLSCKDPGGWDKLHPKETTAFSHTCVRCKHQWNSVKTNPRFCPACGSPFWRTEARPDQVKLDGMIKPPEEVLKNL